MEIEYFISPEDKVWEEVSRSVVLCYFCFIEDVFSFKILVIQNLDNNVFILAYENWNPFELPFPSSSF